jgi:hypothetical protein
LIVCQSGHSLEVPAQRKVIRRLLVADFLELALGGAVFLIEGGMDCPKQFLRLTLHFGCRGPAAGGKAALEFGRPHLLHLPRNRSADRRIDLGSQHLGSRDGRGRPPSDGNAETQDDPGRDCPFDGQFESCGEALASLGQRPMVEPPNRPSPRGKPGRAIVAGSKVFFERSALLGGGLVGHVLDPLVRLWMTHIKSLGFQVEDVRREGDPWSPACVSANSGSINLVRREYPSANLEWTVPSGSSST